MARCLPQPSEAAMAGRLLRGRGPSGFLHVRRFGWKNRCVSVPDVNRILKQGGDSGVRKDGRPDRKGS